MITAFQSFHCSSCILQLFTSHLRQYIVWVTRKFYQQKTHCNLHYRSEAYRFFPLHFLKAMIKINIEENSKKTLFIIILNEALNHYRKENGFKCSKTSPLLSELNRRAREQERCREYKNFLQLSSWARNETCIGGRRLLTLDARRSFLG